MGKYCDPCDNLDDNCVAGNEFGFCRNIGRQLTKDATGLYLRCATCLELFPDGNGLHLGE